jgi:hypothetical protein
MSTPDFSSVFPTPTNNYRCTINPNPGFLSDCTGTTVGSNNGSVGTLPSITKSFTLYNYALPITIQSSVTPENTSNGQPPDPGAGQYWIQPPHVSAPTYSDMYKPNDRNATGPFAWTGFNQALSKCIELDGSYYPPSAGSGSDPALAYPNKKPNCYSVSVQSDYIGNQSHDTSVYSLNYFLSELPTSSTIDPEWLKSHPIDNNYLYCQSQFYTWIKNTPSGSPYNTQPSANFSIASCKAPIYNKAVNDTLSKSNDMPSDMMPSWWGAPLPSLDDIDSIKKIKKVEKPDYTKYYIGGAVAVVVLIILWYFFLGPGSEPDIVIPLRKPIKPVVTTKPGKKGGYFYYEI